MPQSYTRKRRVQTGGLFSKFRRRIRAKTQQLMNKNPLGYIAQFKKVFKEGKLGDTGYKYLIMKYGDTLEDKLGSDEVTIDEVKNTEIYGILNPHTTNTTNTVNMMVTRLWNNGKLGILSKNPDQNSNSLPNILLSRAVSHSNIYNNQNKIHTQIRIFIYKPATEQSPEYIIKVLGNNKSQVLSIGTDPKINYAYILSESVTQPFKRAFNNLPDGMIPCSKEEVMSIFNTENNVNITNESKKKINKIRELYNNSKLAVLYKQDDTNYGMIYKETSAPNSETIEQLNIGKPSFTTLVFLYAYKPNLNTEQSPPSSQPELAVPTNIMNNNIGPYLTGQSINRVAQKALIKLSDNSMKLKVLTRKSPESIAIYPIRMPLINVPNTANILNPGTGIYLNVTYFDSTKQEFINNQAVYYCTSDNNMGELKVVQKASTHISSGVFSNLPETITAIIGQTNEQGKLANNNRNTSTTSNFTGVMGNSPPPVHN